MRKLNLLALFFISFLFFMIVFSFCCSIAFCIDKLVNKGEAEIKVLQVLNEEYYRKVNGAINIANLQKIKHESIQAGKKEKKIKP